MSGKQKFNGEYRDKEGGTGVKEGMIEGMIKPKDVRFV
jgi:hypothetical protein